jgi:hypothetical protein
MDSQTNGKTADAFEVKVLRQLGPGERSYWERHRVAYEPDMNVISILQRIAAQSTTIEGNHVAPWRGIATAWKRYAERARCS